MDDGYPALEMGIGINTGNVIVGNIGSDLRMKYGIVGDTVNRAARIESNSIGGQVLIGESTYRAVQSQVTADPPKTLMMKGMKKPLVFYSVSAIDMDRQSISLDVTASTGPLLEIQIPLHCWLIRDKRLDRIPLAGITLALDETCIHIQTTTAIEPLTDVKLNFDFCLEAHCFDDIYAKCIDTEPDRDGYHSQLHITAMAESDRERIREWMAQASA
jgi:hypothetical protein